jgi:TldD protein
MRVNMRQGRRLAAAVLLATLGCAGTPSRGVGDEFSAEPAGARAAQPPAFAALPAGAAGEPGKAMEALSDELARAMRELGKQDPPPYFIAYGLYDRSTTLISASDGVLMHSLSNQRRTLDVDVRVGDPKFDSTRHVTGLRPMTTVSLRAPLEDDAAALQADAWSATNSGYRQAAGRLAELKTRTRVDAERTDKSPDFSREKPVVQIEAPARVELDRAGWEKRLQALSARFKSVPEVLDSSVSMSTDALTRSVLTSEGSRVQSAGIWVHVSLSAYTRSDDGDFLARSTDFSGRSLADLPSQAELEGAANRLIAELQALRKAPRGEPFAGPTLLEGRAAGVFLHETFGHRLEGSRLKEETDGQTFVKKLGQPVMPSFLSVYDDPTILKLGEEPLNGAYRHDDEGVSAQRAPLIEGGVLRGFLMGRTPLNQFLQSNGHGRRQEGHAPEARQANLVAHPSRALSPEDLRAMLRAEARRQGKSYGLAIQDISGGLTRPGAGSGQGFSLRPTMTYRVYVDGRPDELIRGISMVGTPLTALSKLVAAGDDYAVFNGRCGSDSGWVPVSAVSPSLLIGQLETERTPKGNDRPPLLPRPPLAPEGGAQ